MSYFNQYLEDHSEEKFWPARLLRADAHEKLDVLVARVNGTVHHFQSMMGVFGFPREAITEITRRIADAAKRQQHRNIATQAFVRIRFL